MYDASAAGKNCLINRKKREQILGLNFASQMYIYPYQSRQLPPYLGTLEFEEIESESVALLGEHKKYHASRVRS